MAAPARATGSGLAGLAERAARVRGTLEAGALRGGGYRLRLSVPRAGAVIRVLIAEDQAMVRGALVSLLALEPDIEVVAAGRARRRGARPRRWRRRPDVALLDIEMPGIDGIEATAQLDRALPATRVLILTTFGRPGYLRRALEAGALGVHDEGRAVPRARRPRSATWRRAASGSTGARGRCDRSRARAR